MKFSKSTFIYFGVFFSLLGQLEIYAQTQTTLQDREKIENSWRSQASKINSDFQGLVNLGMNEKIKYELHESTDKLTGAKSTHAKHSASFSKGKYEATVYCDSDSLIKVRIGVYDINLPRVMQGREMTNKNIQAINLRSYQSKNFSNIFEVPIGTAVNRALRDRGNFSDLYDYWYFSRDGLWIPFFIADHFNGERDYYVLMPLPNNTIGPADIAKIMFEEAINLKRTISLHNLIYSYKVEVSTADGTFIVEVPVYNGAVYSVIDGCSKSKNVPLDKIPIKKSLIERVWSKRESTINLINDPKEGADGKYYEDFVPIDVRLY